MAHTPGDWRSFRKGDGDHTIYNHDQTRIIATVHDDVGDALDNVLLIRASPKLLLMLEEFVKINASGEYEFDTNEPRLYKAIVNAIAEAKRTVSK